MHSSDWVRRGLDVLSTEKPASTALSAESEALPVRRFLQRPQRRSRLTRSGSLGRPLPRCRNRRQPTLLRSGRFGQNRLVRNEVAAAARHVRSVSSNQREADRRQPMSGPKQTRDRVHSRELNGGFRPCASTSTGRALHSLGPKPRGETAFPLRQKIIQQPGKSNHKSPITEPNDQSRQPLEEPGTERASGTHLLSDARRQAGAANHGTYCFRA